MRRRASAGDCGEALGNLRRTDPETAEAIPDLHRIVGLRNVLAHGYAVIDDAVVWAAARHRTAGLIAHIDQLLAQAHDS
ncbi:DUF86 domain-containing protein [Microbacterium sp. NPDC089698]|uniref:HepT-like ribonuclease domain-containing protein n=1 Tax=Microbacterium sp. NPDC089698 TaxID=3364200 RepID=UPI0038049A99